MSAIRSIPGRLDPVQEGQVEKTVIQSQDNGLEISTSKIPKPNPEEGLDRSEKTNKDDVSDKTIASYEETNAVAEKLQIRINEVAKDHYKVTIYNDEDTNRYIIEIKDSYGEVVKRFPPEKVLNLHQRLDDLSGMVIDEMI